MYLKKNICVKNLLCDTGQIQKKGPGKSATMPSLTSAINLATCYSFGINTLRRTLKGGYITRNKGISLVLFAQRLPIALRYTLVRY